MDDNRTSSGLRPNSEGRDLALFGNVKWGVREFDGQPVLTATVDGVLHYENAGLCKILRHSNPSKALADWTRRDQRISLDVRPANSLTGWEGYRRGNPNRAFVTREGAYRLLLKSDAPGGDRVREWLADDVMPSIEDNGAYVASGAALALPDTSTPEGVLAIVDMLRDQVMARMADAKTIVKQATRIKALEPAEAMMKTYAGAKGLTAKRAFARDVQQWALDEGHDISQQQVFDFLHHIGLLIRSETSEHDQAMSQAIKDRKAKNVTVKIEHADGSIEKKKYGKLTAKGEDYAWRRIQEAIDSYGTLDLDVIKGVLVPSDR